MNSKEYSTLLKQGYSKEEVNELRQELEVDALGKQGYTRDEINEALDIPEFDTQTPKDWIKETYNGFIEGTLDVAEDVFGTDAGNTVGEAFGQGLQQSVAGKVLQLQNPNVDFKKEQPLVNRLASIVGGISGDVGTIAAGVGIVALTGGGAILAAGAAFGLTMATRKALTDEYENGSVQNFNQFWDRWSDAMVEGGKGLLIGTATAGVGVGVKAAAPAITKTLARLGIGAKNAKLVIGTAGVVAGAGTLVTTGAALEGQTPSWQEFGDMAIIMGLGVAGYQGTKVIKQSLVKGYVNYGKRPTEVFDDMTIDPRIREDILLGSHKIRAYEELKNNPENTLTKRQKEQVAKEEDPIGFRQEEIKKEAESIEVKDIKDLSPLDAARQRAGELIVDPILKAKKLTWSEFYTAMFREIFPFEQQIKKLIQKDKIGADVNPNELLTTMKGVTGEANSFFERGTFDINTKQAKGPGMLEIVNEAKKKGTIADWENYKVAKTTKDRAKRGIETGMSIEDATLFLDKLDPAFAKPFKKHQKYQEDLLDVWKDSGMESAEAVARIREANKHYSPLDRLLEGNEIFSKGSSSRLKAAKGSTKKIATPTETTLKNTHIAFKLAELNKTITAIVELAKTSKLSKSEIAEIITPVKRPVTKTQLSAKQKNVLQEMRDSGLEFNDKDFQVFTTRMFIDKENIVNQYIDGKLHQWKVHPALFKILKADVIDVHPIVALTFGKTAKGLRIGATSNPIFIATNLVRDTLFASILQKNFVPIISSVRGGMDIIGKTEMLKAWERSGGANATWLALDRHYKDIAARKVALLPGKWDVWHNTIDMLRAFSEFSENATRLGVARAELGISPLRSFKKTKEILQETSAADLKQAASKSRKIPFDFAVIGSQTKGVNRNVPFFNAMIQGSDSVIRGIGRDPTGVAIRTTAYIIAPTLALWFLNKDDSRYAELTNTERYNYWHIWMGDIHIRIPKPFNFGLVANVIEESLSWGIKDDPLAFDGMGELLGAKGLSTITPTLLVPAIELTTNKSLFTNKQLINKRLEKQLGETQYTTYTNEIYKKYSQLFNLATGSAFDDTVFASPVFAETFVRAWTGGVGQGFVNALDFALVKAGVLPDKNKPSTHLLEQIPGVRAFLSVHPKVSSRSMDEFFDKYERNEKVINSIKALTEQGKIDEALLLLEKRMGFSLSLSATHTSLTEMFHALRNINFNQDMDSVQKRQLIDSITKMLLVTAQVGNLQAGMFEKEIKKLEGR